MPADTSTRAFSWYDPRQATLRLVLSFAVAFLGGACLRASPWAIRTMAAWDVAGVTFLALSWWIIARADAKETQLRAAAEDPGRTAVWLIVILANLTSLVAATVVMCRAARLAPTSSDTLIVLCLVAVVCAWMLTHSVYTLRYAHLFYRDTQSQSGGLEFPGDEPPSALDFAYFAFTIGMCYQVSDVVVRRADLRHTVLMHAIISFLHNTVVFAVALNLVFGFLK